MSIEDTIAAMQSFIGQNFDDIGSDVLAIPDAAGLPYRWMTPEDLASADFRLDRVNVNVDENHIILSITIG